MVNAVTKEVEINGQDEPTLQLDILTDVCQWNSLFDYFMRYFAKV